jgi:hypothetical protein
MERVLAVWLIILRSERLFLDNPDDPKCNLIWSHVGDREIKQRERENSKKQRLEGYGHKPETRRDQDWNLPYSLWREKDPAQTLLSPQWYQTSGLQNCEQISVCYFQSPRNGCWLSTAASGNKLRVIFLAHMQQTADMPSAHHCGWFTRDSSESQCGLKMGMTNVLDWYHWKDWRKSLGLLSGETVM